jgi:Transglycosylase-like domain
VAVDDRMIAAAACLLTFCAPAPSTPTVVTGPGPGLTAPLRAALETRWYAGATWNEAVEAQRRQNSQMMVTTTGNKSRATSARNHQSDTPASWTGVAACESGGNWSTNTGNGYYGGLQEDMPFWITHGGLAYAPRPDLASPAEQVIVAERAQSRAPWPVCGSR